MNAGKAPSRTYTYWAAALGVLLVVVAFRAVRITETPPGIIHDEVWNRANIDHIRAGTITPYYPVGGGREALYLWTQALSVGALGDNLVAMRLPSIVFSALLAASTIALGARLFGRGVGLAAALALGVCFWAALFGRLAVRNISLPAVLSIALYLLYRALQTGGAAPEPPPGLSSPGPAPGVALPRQEGVQGPVAPDGVWGSAPGKNLVSFVPAGFALGLTAYTFPGAWGLPVLVGPLVIYLALFERERMRGRWVGLALALAVMAVTAAPVVAYRQAHPEMAARAEQVDEPLQAALDGDLRPILENVPLVLSMFTVEGDHGLEYNLQWRPVFPEPLISALFYLGAAAALWRLVKRRSERRLAYVILWLASLAMLAPTLVTSDARNPSRPIGLLAVLFFFVGLGAELVWRWLGGRRLAAALLAATFALNAGLTARDLFDRWNDNPVVQFLYQRDLYQIARYLDGGEAQAGAVTVAGLSPDWVDPTSLKILMARGDLAPGFFDGQGALLLPGSPAGGVVLAPDVMTLHPAVRAMLDTAGTASKGDGFTRWDIASGDIAPPAGYTTIPVDAAGPLATLKEVAYDRLSRGETTTLLTVWETHAPSRDVRLRIFVHLMDAAQTTVYTQHDGLQVPSLQWRAGEVFYQIHTLDLPADLPPGDYALRVGLYEYEPLTWARVPFDDGGDAATVPLTIP